MAATNDSHYLRKEDAKMQAILLCIQTGKTMQDADRMEFQTVRIVSSYWSCFYKQFIQLI